MRRIPLAVVTLALFAACGFAEVKGGSALAAKQSFEKQHPNVRFYNYKGRISRISGPEFAVGNSARGAADGFVVRHSAMLGAKPEDLQFVGEQNVMNGKFTAVRYKQTLGGVPVHDGVLILLSRTSPTNGIVLASNYLYDLSKAKLASVVISGQQAVDRWRYWYPNFIFEKAELCVFVPGEGSPTYGWKFVGGNHNLVTPEKYEFIVDATKKDAPIISQTSLITDTDVSGSTKGWASPGDMPDVAANPETLQPLSDLLVNISGGNSAYSDANGNFTIANAGSSAVTVNAGLGGTYTGRWSKVADQSGAAVLSLNLNVTPPGPADFVFNPTVTAINTAQVNGYLWVTKTHNFVKAINAAYPGVDFAMPTNVNIASTCNAYYDGASVNFYQAGGGCPNTAYSTVVAHEYGHHIVQAGGSGQGAYGEGMGDVTGSLLLDTNCLGRGFQGGTACLRDAYNSISYPVDSYEIHTGGMCISGAFWLTRDALFAVDPVNYLTIIRALWLNSILVHSGSSIDPSITIDVLTLDDDNGDIYDGTPHYAQIAQGFDAKNLDAPPLNLIKFTFPNGQPATIYPDGTTKIRVNVEPVSQNPQPGTGKLYYSTGGSYTQVAMTEITPNVYDAEFPLLPCGTKVNYYFSAQTTGGSTQYSPSTAPASVYTAYVAYGLTTVFNDNFQTNLGWTVTNAGGLTTGAWGRAVPAGGGARGDPPTDYDGSGMCYVTDNRVGDYDVDVGTTYLISPTINLSGGDAIVSYARWYHNSYGGNPHTHTFNVYVSNNNGSSWTLAETVGPTLQSDGGWFTASFRVGQFVAPNATVKVRFEASDSTASPAVVEAGVDAFKVEQFTCSVPSSLSGNVNLEMLDVSPAGQSVTINFYTPGTNTLIASYPTTLDGLGNYNVPSVTSGLYDITAKGANWLRKKLANQLVNGATVANFSLINGDADNNNVVDIFDLNLLLTNYSDPGPGDLNGDGFVGLADTNIVFVNFAIVGD